MKLLSNSRVFLGASYEFLRRRTEGMINTPTVKREMGDWDMSHVLDRKIDAVFEVGDEINHSLSIQG